MKRSLMACRRPVAAAVLASVVLGGCTLAPKHVRPDAPVAETYPYASGVGGGALGESPVAEIGWKSFFQDALLRDLIEVALQNNRDLRVAALNVEVARAHYRVRRADILPNLGIAAEGVKQELPNGLFYNEETYQVNAVVSAWELDVWGRLRSLKGQALESYLALAETQTATQMSLVAEVANAYFTLRADQEMVALASETVRGRAKSYDLTRQRVAAGQAMQLDLHRAEASLRAAEADLAAYTRLAEQDRNALTLLLGRPLTMDKALQLDEARGLAGGVVPETLPAGLPSELLVRRPDIRAAEHRLRGANADIGAARAAFFPSISLTGSAGTASSNLDDLFSSGSDAWSFMPRITVPVFRGGALKANLHRARLQKRIEIATYEKSVQIAFREVADGLAGQRWLDRQIQAETSRAWSSEKALALAEQRYREGEDDNLAMLDAQFALYGAQQSLIRARLAKVTNTVMLYKALGGGWTATSSQQAAQAATTR